MNDDLLCGELVTAKQVESAASTPGPPLVIHKIVGFMLGC
jgi:hypothetical protein